MGQGRRAIPPCPYYVMSCDPELAIAKAKASQDHNKHRCGIGPRILSLNYSQSQSGSSDRAMGRRTGPQDIGHGQRTQDMAIGHRTHIMGHWAPARAQPQKARRPWARPARGPILWPCPVSCGLVPCPMAISYVLWPCPTSYGPGYFGDPGGQLES